MRESISSKVIILEGPRSLKIKEETIHFDTVNLNQVVGATIFSALSTGTEIAAYRGDPPLRPMKPYPRMVGYCNVSEIIYKGNAVSKYEIGDKILTFQPHRSSFICDEDTIITKIPNNANLEETATTYLFHLGYNALLKGGFRAGENVAVVGLGVLGLTTIALASLFGGKVFSFSNQPNILKISKELGAIQVFRKGQQDVMEIIAEKTDDTGIDLVVTTSNKWEDWRLAISLSRKGGKISVLGFPGRGQPIPDFNPLTSQYFYDNQLTLIACGYTPDYIIDPYDIRFTIKRNCKFLLSLIMEKKLPARRLITSIINWQEIGSLYESVSERKVPFLTGILRWQ